jgi:hypothetical protein
MAQVDLSSLRALLYQPLVSGTHDEISDRLNSLGLPLGEGTKAERVTSVLNALSSDGLVRVAQQL